MNDCWVTYIDNEIFKIISNEKNHIAGLKYEDSSRTAK
jgi:hypothetical protein